MILFLKFSFLFSVGAIAGWILEFFYRHFLTRHWVNPGFLNGPWLPLYGFGTVLLYLLSAWPMPPGPKIAGIVIVMTLLELVTGLIFTVFFKIRLWDYSQQFLNFKGIICPLYSFFWGILGIVFTFIIYPLIRYRLNLFLATPHLYYFLGIFNGFFLIDLFAALGILSVIREGLKDTEMIVAKMHVNYEKLKYDLRGWLKENTSRSPGGRYLAPFQGHVHSGVKKLIREQAVKRRDELLKKLALKNRLRPEKRNRSGTAEKPLKSQE